MDVKQNKVLMCEQIGNHSRGIETKNNSRPENVISEIKNSLFNRLKMTESVNLID